MSEHVTVALRGREHSYEILVGQNLLEKSGSWVKSVVSGVGKVVIISNELVFSLYGETVCASLTAARIESRVWKMGDGESFKSLETTEAALRFFSENKLSRSDAVIALGGGVVGDLTGFAAAVYLRGVPFLQIPTTLLSMIDSSVGGKTGVNSSFGKNLIGAFHQPSGVMIDVQTLKTLDSRELTAGFCEAVKHGAISGVDLFNKTSEFLKAYSVADFAAQYQRQEFAEELQRFVSSQVAFKAAIVRNDEFEDITRRDAKSRKILNFGHTVGHALEKVTDYRHFKHGEAVGLGMLAAAEISKKVANFSQNELSLLNAVVSLTEIHSDCKGIDAESVVEAFVFDKKNIASSLQWVLLEAIGKPRIVSGEEISREVVFEAISTVLARR